jgi:hypothetical protein
VLDLISEEISTFDNNVHYCQNKKDILVANTIKCEKALIKERGKELQKAMLPRFI